MGCKLELKKENDMKINSSAFQLDSHIQFRPAAPIDALSITLTAKAVTNGHVDRWKSFSSETIKTLANKINSQSEYFWVAERSNAIIGFVSLCPISKKVTNLLVDDAFNKKVIGFELLKLVEQKALSLQEDQKTVLH